MGLWDRATVMRPVLSRLLRSIKLAIHHQLEVRPCTASDVEHPSLIAFDPRGRVKRWQMQQRGEAIYLVAWRGDVVVGVGTLLKTSRYPEVGETIGEIPEINALYANPVGRGVGTALIDAAEHHAAGWGATRIGIAVKIENLSAQRLYERRGYTDWGRRQVIDIWDRTTEDGTTIDHHEDTCNYLVKVLQGMDG
jgi:GNAT superfamily N-acetyltransferase